MEIQESFGLWTLEGSTGQTGKEFLGNSHSIQTFNYFSLISKIIKNVFYFINLFIFNLTPKSIYYCIQSKFWVLHSYTLISLLSFAYSKNFNLFLELRFNFTYGLLLEL